MPLASEPLVSVVSPFYNTADYLEECIESVLGQTYSNWEYLLVDNCSEDGGGEIADKYAARDRRIRVVHNETFLSQPENFNHALRLISPDSVYCKIVQGDDSLFPECLERMVRLAESDRNVAVVASYFLYGDSVHGGPLPRTVTVVPGPEACRSYFQTGFAAFGSPTTVMYRAELVRATDRFYDEHHLHEDTDALFRLLREWKLGFVHQVLSFVRVGNVSISASRHSFEPYRLDQFSRALLYADWFFPQETARLYRNRAEREYLLFLAERFFRGRGRRFWNYHLNGLREFGYSMPWMKFGGYLLMEMLDLLGNPKRTITALARYAIGRSLPAARQDQPAGMIDASYENSAKRAI